MVRPSVLRLPILLLPALLLAACSRPAPAERTRGEPGVGEGHRLQVEVLVGGTAGVQFEGSLGERGDARAISGRVPARFTARVHHHVFLRVQKAGRDGTMEVRLLVDGREVAAGTTDKPYGLVAMDYPPAPRDR